MRAEIIDENKIINYLTVERIKDFFALITVIMENRFIRAEIVRGNIIKDDPEDYMKTSCLSISIIDQRASAVLAIVKLFPTSPKERDLLSYSEILKSSDSYYYDSNSYTLKVALYDNTGFVSDEKKFDETILAWRRQPVKKKIDDPPKNTSTNHIYPAQAPANPRRRRRRR